MVLGLYYVPAIMGAVVLIACIAGGFHTFFKQTPAKKSKQAFRSLIIAVILVSGGMSVATAQSIYQDNDATIRARLSDIQVSLVGYQGILDNMVTVKASNGCVATYALDVNGPSQGLWPLKPRTGHAVSGCDGQELDKLFIP